MDNVIQQNLVVSEEFDPHPAPEVEEDVDRDGDRQQQAVETQTVVTGAALREVFIHRSRVQQTEERHDWDQPHHHGEGEHTCRRVLININADKFIYFGG